MSAGECVDQPVELDDDQWFEPVIIDPPKPEPLPKPKSGGLAKIVDDINRELGIVLPGANTEPESEPPAPAPSRPKVAQPPPPPVATATQLFRWIKKVLLAETLLSDDAAALVAIWVFSTWHQEALKVFPCLVITGPAHDASRFLHILKEFCCVPALLPGLRRSHLGTLRGWRTFLISEPNLDKQTANLLSSLTDRQFLIVEGGDFGCYSKSAAIYAGEDPETHKIQNSIHIHIIQTNAERGTSSRQRLQEMTEHIPVHLKQYREKNLSRVRGWTWTPSGVTSETATVATELGRCIVDAPELRVKLLDLVKTHDLERLADIVDTIEALALEAILKLCDEDTQQIFAAEIATEVNRIAKERGEHLTYSPEKIGHTLKKIGLPTRRLGKAGKGLVMDQATITRLHELAGVYGGAGLDLCDTEPALAVMTETK